MHWQAALLSLHHGPDGTSTLVSALHDPRQRETISRDLAPAYTRLMSPSRLESLHLGRAWVQLFLVAMTMHVWDDQVSLVRRGAVEPFHENWSQRRRPQAQAAAPDRLHGPSRGSPARRSAGARLAAPRRCGSQRNASYVRPSSLRPTSILILRTTVRPPPRRPFLTMSQSLFRKRRLGTSSRGFEARAPSRVHLSSPFLQVLPSRRATGAPEHLALDDPFWLYLLDDFATCPQHRPFGRAPRRVRRACVPGGPGGQDARA